MTPTEWLLSDDTGTSSKTICAVMTGSVLKHTDIPHDPDDFSRCYRLLKHFPLWAPRMQEVAAKHAVWGPIITAWDELSRLYETKDNGGLYSRMRELEDAGRVAAGWKKTAPGCWEGPHETVVELGPGVKMSFGR